MSGDVNKLEGWEELGWKKTDNLEGEVRQDNKMIEMINNSAKKVEESLQQTSKLEEYVSDDKDPIEKKMVDSLGRNVIDYKNGTKVIQDTKNNTQEIFGNDGGWSRYSKESGEWKKIEEGKYTEVTSESGDKYTQVEHVKDGKPFKVSRIYEHGKVVEEMVGDTKVTPEDLQKKDMPDDGKKEESAQVEDEQESVENVVEKMKEDKINSTEVFAYMDKTKVGMNPDGTRKLWSELTEEEQNKIYQGVLEGRKSKINGVMMEEPVEKEMAGLPEDKKEGVIIDQTLEKAPAGFPETNVVDKPVDEGKKTEVVSEKLVDEDEGKLNSENETTNQGQKIEGIKDNETSGKVDSKLTEMAAGLPKVEQKTETVAVSTEQPTKEEKFEKVEMQEIKEKPLTLEQKQQKFLEQTINELTYRDIADNSPEQDELVKDAIQVIIDNATELNLGESQKQSLFRSVDLLRYPDKLATYPLSTKEEVQAVADLVGLKNPELAKKILERGPIAQGVQTSTVEINKVNTPSSQNVEAPYGYNQDGTITTKEQYDAIQQMVTNAKTGLESEGVNKSTEILNQ